ncbi:MAG TPA: DUF2993 domain-containing protein [Leptolyngbyaceae cyanobacterium M33_DOE_097]|nr:DUF2993 domain-containing protein [Leptolyngbyaceae cyanobacterium M33_DOE_097]
MASNDPESVSDSSESEALQPSTQSEMPAAKQSRIISRVLSPAVKFWLKSQLELVENLALSIQSGDRQLLNGVIQTVTVSADRAIYQGLHFNQVRLTAEQIWFNLRQVVQGKAFQLLKPFDLQGSVHLAATELNSSLQSPLLQEPVKNFLLMLLQDEADVEASNAAWELKDPKIVLDVERITLGAVLVAANGKEVSAAIRTRLAIAQGNCLVLQNPEWLPHINAQRGLPIKELENHVFQLGSHVNIENLLISADGLTCQGRIVVMPE